MLKKTSITDIPMLSEEWFQARLAKITASEFHFICGDKFKTIDCNKYIMRKVYEELSGLPSKDPVNTAATEHGHKYEAEGITSFGKAMGLEFVVTQKLVTEPGSRFGCTPDFLVVLNESQDKTCWNVMTGEVKCPLAENFIALARCKTPDDIYRQSKIYYWQVIFQMIMCDALRGFLVVYNPFVRVGKLNIVEFNKPRMIIEAKKASEKDPFTLAAERQQMAIELFDEIRDEFIKKG